ncbi:hypothetical protein NPIL_495441 [Nephila pilipes]|uniref:Uncharacterized protein n=1 Tax=Nephila pilipes TaxID=299642 RepID=A0A8X6MYD5_NEPPI|nr:hypothetical protein NPIL_495441 [Nephila pilipes]
MWKCCGKTFSDYAKYNKHVLINHNKNADYGRTIASNRNGRTTLDESQDGCSKQIRVTKSTTGTNEQKKDISVVDSNPSDRISETPTKNEYKKDTSVVDSNHSDTISETPTKHECKKNIALTSMKIEFEPTAQHKYGWFRNNNLIRIVNKAS